MMKKWLWFTIGLLVIGGVWHFWLDPHPPSFPLPESLTNGDEVLDFEVQ